MKNPSTAALGTPGAPAPDVRRVSLYQARSKIHPRAVKGTFATWRWAMVWLTQIVFYGLPWLEWNGRQAVLLDLASRRFYILGLVLYPQDFIYLTALLVTSAYALFLFTALSGRLWCGYACPQTVYTEIFMWVEQRFEGDRNARIRLDHAPWSLDKLWRRTGKHLGWIAIAAWTGFSFVGYFTPIRSLAADALALQLSGWPLFWMPFYAFATWGFAGFMREQVCRYMCPYARFQSAMLDRDTLIVTYDAGRGEPRAPLRPASKAAAPATGACVDCGLCVQVCPTGIDIRKGLQYECIGCGACIDACDEVMRRAGRPTGLVRYDTQNGLDLGLTRRERLRHVLRPRTLVYGSILVLIVGAVATGLALRPPFKADVVRDRATLARLVDDGQVENVYRVQIMNATEVPQRYRVGVGGGLPGLVPAQPVTTALGPAEAQWVVVALRVPAETAAAKEPGAHPIRLDVERLAEGGQPAYTLSEKTTFVLPR